MPPRPLRFLAGLVFSKRPTQILGLWLVEMDISTNHKPKIWVDRSEKTGLGPHSQTVLSPLYPFGW